MYQVLKEYEKTISELIADKERDKKALEAEVGQATLIMINHFKMGGNLHIFFSGGKNAAGEGSGSGGPSGALNALELFWVLSTE